MCIIHTLKTHRDSNNVPKQNCSKLPPACLFSTIQCPLLANHQIDLNMYTRDWDIFGSASVFVRQSVGPQEKSKSPLKPYKTSKDRGSYQAPHMKYFRKEEDVFLHTVMTNTKTNTKIKPKTKTQENPSTIYKGSSINYVVTFGGLGVIW